MLTIGQGSAVTSARGVRLNPPRLASISNNVTGVSDLPKRVCMMCVWKCTLVWQQRMCLEMPLWLASVGAVSTKNRAIWLAVEHEGVVRGMPTATTPAVSSQLIMSTARSHFRGGQAKDGEATADWVTGGDLDGGQECAWRLHGTVQDT